jgi:UDP-N-acetylglucosamine transferase subunit ALG13
MKEKLKICLACSIGGHFTQMLELKEVYEKYDHFFVTNPGTQTISALANERKYFIPERIKKSDFFFKQLFMSLKILLKEKPDVIITTGSGDAFWMCVFGKLFGKKVVFIESFSKVTTPSKFGRMAYKFADLFIYQWEKLKEYYPKGFYGGIIFNPLKFEKGGNNDNNSCFVTIGTYPNGFPRLLKKIDELIERGFISGKVFAQIGHSKYLPKSYKYKSFFGINGFENKIKENSVIITHAGIGSVITALKFGKKTIVVPRYKKFNEAVNDHQLEITQELERQGKIIAVYEIDNLAEAIIKVKELKASVIENQDTRIKETITEWLKKESIRRGSKICILSP